MKKSQLNQIIKEEISKILNEDKGPYITYNPSTFRKPSGYKEEVEQIKNLIKKTYPEYINNNIGNIIDADMELRVLAWKVYGFNISVDEAYDILSSIEDDTSELPKELILKWNKIEELSGEPMIALRQAMEELNIKI
jgi:hypothetical protein